MPKKLLIKIISFALLIGLLLYINQAHVDLHPEQIQFAVLSFGIWAPLIFILIFSLRPFVLFPASILAIAGGLSFGPILGPIVTYIGSLAGAILSFFLIRKLGTNFQQKKWRGRGELIQKKIEENGFFYVMALRIIPVINFDFVTYLSALSRIPFKRYLLATMVGVIPGTLAFNFLGASFVELNATMLIITGAMFLIAFSIPVMIRKIMKKKNMDIDLLPDEKL
ncbi:TVP38/TMEM64 family protein [Salipaludibacillus keqinensis]|uniref:TVP38/TMEM64 family membrane protein n=1 Tax=Salipaludibacillus keqinensis TaxID=2045207 RepID=A0A323TRD0_9BACI|nr:TVP38/TMEM64 family protein [Salipaludibacillus keqinensis]PYZ95093.1 TVP38/TMEM64 family protein [Salipaludibacillus keqinensis]